MPGTATGGLVLRLGADAGDVLIIGALGGGAMTLGGGPFPDGWDTPVRLAPQAWQVVVPIGLTKPQRRHLYGVLTRAPIVADEPNHRAPALHVVTGPNFD